MAVSSIKVPEELSEFLEVQDCSDFNDRRYYVTQDQVDLIKDILKMRKVTSVMRDELGIGYLNSTLLYGPTGTGKTTMCRYIAYKLNLQFAYINFAQLIDGMFGSTTRNLDKIFHFMADNECVFVLDEIDCIATKRGNESAASGGELSRITVTLMQELDYFRAHKVDSIIIGCTNVIETLDPALRSRFAMEKEICNLTNPEKEGFLRKYLEDAKVPYDPENIRSYCAGNSMVTQRKMESDMIRAIATWVANDRHGTINIKSIRES